MSSRAFILVKQGAIVSLIFVLKISFRFMRAAAVPKRTGNLRSMYKRIAFVLDFHASESRHSMIFFVLFFINHLKSFVEVNFA
jgi:hypothetical protein